MNLILLFPEDFTGEKAHTACIKGRRYEHIVKVHGAEVGSKLRVGLLNNRMGEGIITRMGGDSLDMAVTYNQAPPAELPVTLILALPRPKVLKRVLLSATSMGVKRIILMNSWRVDKSFWQSPATEPEKIRKQLILGLEQARDTILPRIEKKRLFKPFVEDELPGIIMNSIPILFHPGSSKACSEYSKEKHLTVLIGPEGGLIPYEVEKLKDAGFSMMSLGERILRVETAVAAILSKFI
ncbi:16S rRNA (uracil(1498)-N(3))-methyltransferase [Candidatus Riflebacteria bacterium]